MARKPWHPKECVCADCAADPLGLIEPVGLESWRETPCAPKTDAEVRADYAVGRAAILADMLMPPMTAEQRRALQCRCLLDPAASGGDVSMGAVFEFANSGQHQRKVERIRSFVSNPKIVLEPKRALWPSQLAKEVAAIPGVVSPSLYMQRTGRAARPWYAVTTKTKTFVYDSNGNRIKPKLSPVRNMHVAPGWVCRTRSAGARPIFGSTPELAYLKWVHAVTARS